MAKGTTSRSQPCRVVRTNRALGFPFWVGRIKLLPWPRSRWQSIQHNGDLVDLDAYLQIFDATHIMLMIGELGKIEMNINKSGSDGVSLTLVYRSFDCCKS
jgi:hypothetical protein